MIIKKCPRCGSDFRCDGEGDCWCESIPLHRAQIQEILETFTDCICPACMKDYEARE